jgi:hypothetical protein
MDVWPPFSCDTGVKTAIFPESFVLSVDVEKIEGIRP